MEKNEKLIGAATWTGRQQAFAVIAAKCNYAQAESLRQLREAKAYKEYGLTWEEFCKQHVGIVRSRVDRIIHQLNTFGEDYFRLSAIVDISDKTYRAIEPQVQNESLVIDGKKIALIPENASQIRTAIGRLREEMHTLQVDSRAHRCDLSEFHTRLSDMVQELSRRAEFPLPGDEPDAFVGIVDYAVRQLRVVQKEFQRRPRAVA